jgi:predicted transcriptional regulator
MSRSDPIQGELQAQIMKVIWKSEVPLGVEQVRKALPKASRGAYNTVQTVLNRLAERGLLRRHRVGKAIRYSPKVSEADYLTGSLTRSLAAASEPARRVALASLVGDLGGGELDELRELAREIEGKRRTR